nr:iron export ABC transporter permease subunit FetB [Methanocalculus alkaliphilus]
MSYDPSAGFLNLGIATLLLLAIIVILHVRRIGISRELIVGAARAILQLAVIVVLLVFVFESGNFLLIILMLIGMTLVAAWTSALRARSSLAKPFMVTLPSIAAGSFVSISALVITGVIPITPAFLIPMGSMAIGASMIVSSLSIDRFIREMEIHNDQVEMALSLGASPDEATTVYMREGVRSSMIPAIDRLKTLGIVILPGAMAGMLIAGLNPYYAAEYQLIIVFLLIVAEAITAQFSVFLASRQIFDDRGRIIRLHPHSQSE